MAVRTPAQALAAALDVADSETERWHQMCKAFCRTMYGVPSDGTVSARAAWAQTKFRGKGAAVRAPMGALIWWTGGSSGHVVICDGKGNGIGNSFRSAGRVRLLPISSISAAMGSKPAGWSYDIDGVRVVPALVPGQRRYVVREGDTLSAIAREHNTTVDVLAKLNKLDNLDVIAIGRKLKLPHG